MPIVSSSICELMMQIYCKDLGISTSIYDIQALKGGIFFPSVWGDLVEMINKNTTNRYNIIKRWYNLGPTSRFEIDSTLSLSQLVISNNISRSGYDRIENYI